MKRAYPCEDEMTFESATTLPLRTRRFTIDELAAAQGVVPMFSTEEWAGDIFDSDEELRAFLLDVSACRNASLGEADAIDRLDEEAR